MGRVRTPRRSTFSATVPVLILSSLTLLTISACSSTPSTPSGTVELSVEVHQTRSNVADRQLTIGVTNESAHPVEITSARFTSDQFASAAVWQKASTTIGPGVTADLPVLLPATNCAAKDPQPAVDLEYRQLPSSAAGEGSDTPGTEATRSINLEPVDTLGQLKPLFLADCFAEAVGQVATITADTAPRLSTIDEQLVADLDITVVPEGGRGSLTIVSARSTTLFSQVDPFSTAPTENRQVDVAVSGTSQPATIALRVVPARCDPHAVAEDKLGTVFPLEVSVELPEDEDSQTGTLAVATSPEVRAQLYAFVERACSG